MHTLARVPDAPTRETVVESSIAGKARRDPGSRLNNNNNNNNNNSMHIIILYIYIY